jgi:hypothetical protein
MTEWKDIPDFAYEISDYGDVRSKKFKRILTPNADKDGYKHIGLRKLGDRKKYWFRVHRLVATAFCHNPDDGVKSEVDHIDRNVTNNHYTNLRWVDKKENNSNRKGTAWATNKTTGELYITKYSNGFMIRINRHDFKHKSWHKTLEDAIEHRKFVVEGAMVNCQIKFSNLIS